MEILKKIKQYLCNHIGARYLSYYDDQGFYREVTRCDGCGFGSESYKAAEDYLLDTDKTK